MSGRVARIWKERRKRTFRRRLSPVLMDSSFGHGYQKERQMAKAMTKSQILTTLAEKCEMTKKDATTVVEALVNLAYKEAKNGFTIPGLGKLVLQKRKARMGRNPATGEAIKIPAKRVVKFRVAKAAKDAIL